MQDAVIFDLDGTLLDIRGFEHLGLPGQGDYSEFIAASSDAPTIAWVAREARQWRERDVEVVILTARSVQWRLHTQRWLAHNNIHYNVLRLRGRSQRDLTAEYYKQVVTTRYPKRPVFAYDDQKDICDMYTSLHIPNILVSPEGPVIGLAVGR